MPDYPEPSLPGSEVWARCPECGASVPVVADRWLHVHREGSPEYAYPRRGGPRRCRGSLLPVGPHGPDTDPSPPSPHTPFGS
jgi:hypothetical protein